MRPESFQFYISIRTGWYVYRDVVHGPTLNIMIVFPGIGIPIKDKIMEVRMLIPRHLYVETQPAISSVITVRLHVR